MKRKGFTLIEILITLGIIGVVAALVIPTFTESTQKRKIAPKLVKAVSSFEQSALVALDNVQYDTISEAGWNTPELLFNHVANHLKGAISADKNSYTSSAGFEYNIVNGLTMPTGTITTPAHNTALTSRSDVKKAFIIDIDGQGNGEDKDGLDRFYFTLMDDGSLVPWGTNANDSTTVWTTTCAPNAIVPASNSVYCAGHVMETLKATYKLGSGSSEGSGSGQQEEPKP